MNKLPKDRAQWAKAIGDQVTGVKTKPRLSVLRQQAGAKGGVARAAVLSKKRRREIAINAAAARWNIN